MDELLELRRHIEQGRYPEALVLIGALEEMSRDDKINKIESYLHILLLHLIKQHAESRSTRSWEVSISNAVDGVRRSNKRRKAGGWYLNARELQESLEEIFPAALRHASLEAFEGQRDAVELAAMIDRGALQSEALALILAAQG